jgi:hypothetical protein
MKPFLARISLIAVLGSPALAQQVVFHDGFENGLANWTASGLWNLEDSGDPCGAQAGPFVEGTKAAWYGIEGACNFDTPGVANGGSLALNAWIDLPDAASISLRFWSWSETEYCWGFETGFGWIAQWDIHSVHVEAQNGPNAGFSQELCSYQGPTSLLLPWHERRIDLSAYAGARVRVTFSFNTADDSFNAWLGWLIDDVSIIAEPGERVCPPAGLNSGCPCMSAFVPVAGGCRNSTEQSATLLSGGTASVAADTLVFTAAHMPLTTLPTLFQGTTSVTAATFGDGLRCIGGTQLRMGTLVASNGTVSWPPPGGQPLSVKGQVPPAGGARYYQVIYRNAASYCTSATFNLTDAQRVVWLP